MYNDVSGAVQGIAAGLGVAAEHVYSVLVTQQVVLSIVYIIVLLLGLLAGYISYSQGSKVEWKNGDIKDGHVHYFVTAIIFGVIGIIAFLTGALSMEVIITGLVNPEYGAMKEVMRFIK